MTTQAPTRCTIRVSVAVTSRDTTGITVDYMGEEFYVVNRDILSVDSERAIVRLDAEIIRPTGKASYLAAHRCGSMTHTLRVHVQQVEVTQ